MSGELSLPRLYVRDRVIFPNMLFSITVKDNDSIQILNKANEENANIFTVLQSTNKIYQIGTVCSVLAVSKAKDGYVALLYGIQKVIELEQKGNFSLLKPISRESLNNTDEYEFKTTYDRVIEILKKFQDVSKQQILNKELTEMLSQLSPAQTVNLIITKLNVSSDLAQEIYEMNDLLNKLNRLYFAILDQIRIITSLSDYKDLPDEIKNILVFMNGTTENNDSLLVLGFVINDYLKHQALNKKQTKAIQELRKSLLLSLNSAILN